MIFYFVYLQATIGLSPATLRRLSLSFIVVARHCTLYPFCQQIRPQMLWLKESVLKNSFIINSSYLTRNITIAWRVSIPIVLRKEFILKK